ncbi:MAG: hypothetical protein RID91_17865 [Azospirillaceae bacterium]
MSIVPLARVTVYGLIREKADVLDALQGLGCLHLAPLAEREVGDPGGPSPEAREALAFLLAAPHRRRQVHDPSGFDPDFVQRVALGVREGLRDLADERDALVKRIEALEPWGEFRLPEREALGGFRLFFHVVPLYRLRALDGIDIAWQEVNRDNRFAYVVTIAREPPPADRVPAERVEPGDRPLSALVDRLDRLELEMQDLEAERASLTRWCDLFAADLARLEDRAARRRAAAHTLDQDPVFALGGWAPVRDLARLRAAAERRGLVLVAEPPARDAPPPTLIEEPGIDAGGADLVRFYQTPGYWTWDPSRAVFYAFAAFFAMILSDAGYAALLGLGLLVAWPKLGGSALGRRLRSMFVVLLGAAVVWGVAVGGYFGVAPPEGSLLAHAAVVDLSDHGAMMTLSVLVGVGHVMLANIATAASLWPSSRALAPIGWVVMLASGTAIWLAGPAPATIAPFVLGGLLVAAFTAPEAGPVMRLLRGLLGLAGIANAFGDVLSYLRLFALGLASASLALAFNDLAGQVAAGVPGAGVLLAGLVLIVGHALNLALAVVGGFVHGLRLNFIEFFKWSVSEEGYPFRAFAKRETVGWNR